MYIAIDLEMKTMNLILSFRLQRFLLWMIFLGMLNSNVETAHPLKILGLFPHPGMSHFQFFHPLLRGLAEVGHEVTVISHFPDKSPPARYIDLPLEGLAVLKDSVDLKAMQSRSQLGHLLDFFVLHNWGKDACNLTLRSNGLQQVLKKKDYYDVVLTEQFCSDCMSAVAFVLNAPVIAMSSCGLMPWHYQRFGAPYNPAFIPNSWMQYSEDMTFFERLNNWLTYHLLTLMHKYIDVPSTDGLVRHKFGHDLPSVGELVKETSIIFVNQHFSLSGVKPLPPSIIEIGGIHIQKAKPLSVELQKYLDNAEHGVVIISWGHMILANSMPVAKRDGLVQAIKRLKQKVIWKWENDTLPNKPENLMIANWLPQRDVLCHPNVKVFMTHGGLMGSSEAAYCGVPVVVTPLYGDQFLNAAAMEYRGMGVKLLFDDINESTVLKALKRAMEKRYQDNAKAVSHEFKQRPQNVLQTAIWWVEHIARTEGAPLLKSTATYMNTLVYNSIDVLLFLFWIILLIVFTWIWLLAKVCGLKRKGEEKTKKE